MSARASQLGNTAAKLASGATAAGLLQRKCSCGASRSSLAQSCEECKRKPLQRKLSVGRSDDRLELEADRVAEQVLHEGHGGSPEFPAISRLGAIATTSGADADIDVPASVDSVLASAGRPLEPALRQDMESRFGHDFGAVRIHTGAGAERSAHELNAAAFTVGQQVVFGAGQFAPQTRAGRHLLAHELTHVVQQSAPARTPVGLGSARIMRQPSEPDRTPDARADFAPRVPEAVTPGNMRKEVSFLPMRENVQWHVPPSAAADHFDNGYGLDLGFGVFDPHDPKGHKYSAQELANFSIDALLESSGLVFRAGAREYLANFIASVIVTNSYGLEHATGNFIEVDGLAFYGVVLSANLLFDFSAERNFRSLFEPDSWKAWTDYLRSNFADKHIGLGKLLVAAANFGDTFASKAPKEKKKPVEKRPGWTVDQENGLRKRIDAARKQSPRPDLPDRLVFYPHKDGWFVNVWVHFDVAGRDATHAALRLKQGEKPDDLYQRTLQAVQEALEIHRGEDRQRLEAEMPQWAADLKDKVQRALGKETGDDVPDGMTLVLEGRGAPVRGPGQENVAQEDSPDTRDTQVLLRIWVYRGDKGKPENRQQGSVPIFPRTDAGQLVRYVRNLAAVLHQGEHVPDAEFHASYDLGEQMLPNFDAMILPLDLSRDSISVVGATNKFSLFLDFDKQYNAIGADPLYVASKLYSQPIYYHWRIFEAPRDAALGNPTDEWAARWEKLYDHFNPGSHVKDKGAISATSRAGLVDEPAGGYDTGDNDITTRVDLPDTPGDYLVYCQTRHEPIGDAKLKRVSSVAYFPVRLRSREDLMRPMVTGVSSAVTAVDANLADLRERLAQDELHPGTLDPLEKSVLQESLKSTEAEKEMLFAREHGDFAVSASAQIKLNWQRLKVVKRLKERLPLVLEQAKANAASGTGSSKPTELLADSPDLLAMYLELRAAQLTAAGYEKQLAAENERLTKERDRAAGFRNKFKAPSAGGCMYSPEAVFLSKIDGRLYPLELEVGEAPPRATERVAYSVVDVTLPETSKSYHGMSMQYGEGGHREAINKAFEKFGDEGMYGDGWIAVRMPVGGPGNECATYRNPDVVYYDSEKGILDKVLKILGLLAGMIAVFALTLTGVGMAGAGALIGLLAASIGAAAAIKNIGDRSDRNTLKFDAELVSDILSIVGVAEAAIGARLATLPRALRGVEAFQRMGNFLALLQLGTGTAQILLIPIQAIEDINRIKALGLPPDVERQMLHEAYGTALMSAVMATASIVHSRIDGRMRQTGMPVEEEYAALRQQAELVALENEPPPASLRDRGWVDADGNWTDLAPEPIRNRVRELGGDAPTDPAKPHGPTEPIPEAAQHTLDQINNGEARIEGKTPGKRSAKVGGHEVDEELEPDGHISCFWHSPNDIQVDCPAGLGSPKPDHEETVKPAARTSTEADEAQARRKPVADADENAAVKPRNKAKTQPAADRVEGEHLDATVHSELVAERAHLRERVNQNDRVIRDNRQNLAEKKAAVAKASENYTSTPHGNSSSEPGRQQMKKRARALRTLNDAEDELRAAEGISNKAQNENSGHYRRLMEIDRELNPWKYPQSSGEKGTFAEEQGDIAIRAGSTVPAPGESERLVGDWEWKGSAQKPFDESKAKPQGLDGGYRNRDPDEGPRHMAAEFKHDDAPFGPEQETYKWVDDRLEDALGWEQAEAMRREGYEYWEFRYRPGSKTVEAKFLWEWRATGVKNARNQWEGTVHYRRKPK